MTHPVPHWPGRLVSLAGGERVYVVETPGPVRGDKGLVLCVHGMCGAAANWTDFMAELAPDFDCKAVDLPGSGFSPPPRRPSGYSVKSLARTVIRLIEALDAGPVHLVGNSMGALASIRVAASRPDLVRTLTLISPPLPDRTVSREHLRFSMLALPVLGTWLMRRAERRIPPENRVAGVIAACYCDPAAMHPERFELEVAELRRRDGLGYGAVTVSRAAQTIVGEHLRPRRFSLWRLAGQVPVPAVVTFGSHDRLVNPRLAAPAARAFRDASVIVLQRAGHVAHMEHPALVAERFREMVERTRARGMPGDAAGLTPDEVPST